LIGINELRNSCATIAMKLTAGHASAAFVPQAFGQPKQIEPSAVRVDDERGGIGGVHDFRQQHQELIATVAADGIGLAQLRFDATRRQLHGGIADDHRTERVDEHQRQLVFPDERR
jgi:hypothetical protein